MARPQKEGLDYFPLDVDIDQDDKLIVTLAKYGVKGFGTIVRLMMAIYKNGYHYRWGEKEQYTFANRINVDINIVNEIVNECAKWGFFHQEMLEAHGILTSKGFQNRYIEAAKRRKEVTVIDDHVLADLQQLSTKHKVTIIVVSADGKQVNVYKNELNDYGTSTETPQSKVKESKAKEKEKTDKNTRQKRTYAEDSSPYLMALYLHNKIMVHAEESGVAHLLARSNLQSWADECRKLLEMDKVDKSLIRDVIDWSTKNEFWKTNILSAATLRGKFAKLAMEMKKEQKGSIPNDPTRGKSGKPLMPVVQDTDPAPTTTPEEREKMRELARRLRDGP